MDTDTSPTTEIVCVSPVGEMMKANIAYELNHLFYRWVCAGMNVPSSEAAYVKSVTLIDHGDSVKIPDAKQEFSLPVRKFEVVEVVFRDRTTGNETSLSPRRSLEILDVIRLEAGANKDRELPALPNQEFDSGECPVCRQRVEINYSPRVLIGAMTSPNQDYTIDLHNGCSGVGQHPIRGTLRRS